MYELYDQNVIREYFFIEIAEQEIVQLFFLVPRRFLTSQKCIFGFKPGNTITICLWW